MFGYVYQTLISLNQIRSDLFIQLLIKLVTQKNYCLLFGKKHFWTNFLSDQSPSLYFKGTLPLSDNFSYFKGFGALISDTYWLF